MGISEQALSKIENTGISITIILLIAAAIYAYFTIQQIKLTNLNIRKAEKDLGLDHPSAPLEELISKIKL